MAGPVPCRPGNRRPAESGPRFPVPGRIGNRGFPVSRPNRESGIPSPIPGKKSGIGADSGGSDSRFPSESEHQPQWTRNILSREYHASALTGSMRLLFRVREREHAAVICLPRLRKVASSGSRNLPVAQPGTDVMRDVLRLVDVDLLQNCNGRSTIAQADDLLKRVVRHGGQLIRQRLAA